MQLAMFLTECVKEAYVGEKSAAVSQLEGRGESVSSSMTDDQPSEEVNLLPTAAPDDDCFTPVISFPPDIVTSVEILGEGIFGEVFVVNIMFRLVSCSKLGVTSYALHDSL